MTFAPFASKRISLANDRVSRDDSLRQESAAGEILRRFERQPGVVLADEVGMGKTFVAMAVAASVIIDRPDAGPVVVMVPSSLKHKWPKDWELFQEKCLARSGRRQIRAESAKAGVAFLKLLDDPPDRRAHIIFLTHGALHRSLKDGFAQLALIKRAFKGRSSLSAQRNKFHKFAGRLLRLDSSIERRAPGLLGELLERPYESWLHVIQRAHDAFRETITDDPVPAHLAQSLDAMESVELSGLVDALYGLPLRESDNVQERLVEIRRVLKREMNSIWRVALNRSRFRSPLARIDYLLSIPNDADLKGDLRVLERLIEKEDAAHKNLGDVAWLMNLHEAEKEEERIAQGLEAGEKPESVIPEEEAHSDLMAMLFGDGASAEASEYGEAVRLLADEQTYAREAFQEVLDDGADLLEWHEHLDGFTLHPPEDLLRRFSYLPTELRGERNELKLTVDRKRVMEALEAARQDERKWPEWQLFWEQHPVAEWLDDRVLAKFARHEAPVLRLGKGLSDEETVVLFQGVVSNHRSQPTIVEWFGVRFTDGQVSKIEVLIDIVTRTELTRPLANPGKPLQQELAEALESLLPAAVKAAREYMLDLRRNRMEQIAAPLREELRKLKEWRDRRLDHLGQSQQMLFEGRGSLGKAQKQRFEDEATEVTKRYQARCDWINEGMQTVSEPYLRVAAVLIPTGVN